MGSRFSSSSSHAISIVVLADGCVSSIAFLRHFTPITATQHKSELLFRSTQPSRIHVDDRVYDVRVRSVSDAQHNMPRADGITFLFHDQSTFDTVRQQLTMMHMKHTAVAHTACLSLVYNVYKQCGRVHIDDDERGDSEFTVLDYHTTAMCKSDDVSFITAQTYANEHGMDYHKVYTDSESDDDGAVHDRVTFVIQELVNDIVAKRAHPSWKPKRYIFGDAYRVHLHGMIRALSTLIDDVIQCVVEYVRDEEAKALM